MTDDDALVFAVYVLLGLPVSRYELVTRIRDWASDEAERNCAVVEAEHHTGYAALHEEDRRRWDAHFGEQLAVEITDERLDRFLADNPDIARRGVVDA